MFTSLSQALPHKLRPSAQVVADRHHLRDHIPLVMDRQTAPVVRSHDVFRQPTAAPDQGSGAKSSPDQGSGAKPSPAADRQDRGAKASLRHVDELTRLKHAKVFPILHVLGFAEFRLYRVFSLLVNRSIRQS